MQYIKVAEVPPCGAKTTSGGTCRMRPVNGRNRCRYHGGLSLSGVASPLTKNKPDRMTRLTRSMEDTFRNSVLASYEDENQLCLSADIAIIDGLMENGLERLSSGKSKKRWQDLNKLINDVVSGDLDEDKAHETRDKIIVLLSEEEKDYAARAELVGLIEQRTKIVSAEIKRLVAINMLLSIDDVTAVIDTLFAVFIAATREFADPEAAKKIIVLSHAEYRKFIPNAKTR